MLQRKKKPYSNLNTCDYSWFAREMTEEELYTVNGGQIMTPEDQYAMAKAHERGDQAAMDAIVAKKSFSGYELITNSCGIAASNNNCWREKNLRLCMKKKVLFVLIVFLFSFYCHAAETIEPPLIYYRNNSIIIGDTVVPVPLGNTGSYEYAFDGKRQKLWFQDSGRHTSTFICVNTKGQIEDTFTIDFGKINLINGRFFVFDNKALICDHTKEFMRLIVDLETKEYKSIDISKMRYNEISCLYDNKIFFFDEHVEKSVMYFDCLTGEIFYAETDLQGYGFMPLTNAYVGLNKKGKIVIQKFDTGEIIETNISGIKGRPLGKVNDRYYMTEKYLYFSKKDRWYSFTHGMFFARFVFGLGPVQVAHKWYRYSLETGEIEEIKTDYPFINLLGVVEE